MKKLHEVLEAMGSTRGQSLPTLGNKLVRSKTYYKAGKLSDLSSQNGKMLLPSDRPDKGITNFIDGNRLPKGTEFFIEEIRVLFDTTVGATLQNANWAESAPVCFLNGEFEITQQGTGTLFQSSGTDVTNTKAATGNQDDFREIKGIKLRDEVIFDIVASLVGAVPVDALYKVELRGTEFPTANLS
jgi:hypothetical protein